jgi:hypothetical protein
MNLKKLFSPSALATTVAAGMLLHTATVALAHTCYSVSAVFQFLPPTCGSGSRLCSVPAELGFSWFWCCPNDEACGVSLFNGYGWCCPDGDPG